MAEASRFLRTWSGMVVTGGLAFVLVTMGVIFVPNIFESHSLLKKISQRFNWKWSDIATAANTALTAPTPASPQDLTAQNPAEAKETSQVVAAASDTNNQDLGAPEVPVEAVDNHALSLLTLNPQSPPDTLAPSCREPFTRVLADTLLLECPPFEVCRLRELAPTLSRDEELISQGKTSSLGSD